MTETIQYMIDDYLTSMWSDDPYAERRSARIIEELKIEHGEAKVLAWCQERSKVIYG